jgi:Tfp pilus assembly protein PilF/DnaJ-domain-containing protein 1
MTEFPLKGNIREFPLPRVLIYLNRNRKSGTLIVDTHAFTKKVYIDKGDVIFASSTYEDDRLGEMLVKTGKITIEQYEESVKLLKTTKKRQGAILVELGYLTPKDLFWGVKYQVREIIYSLFPLDIGEYKFLEGEIPTNEVITLKMSTGNLIYEGVRRVSSINKIKMDLPDLDSVLQLSTDPASLFQDVEFSARDKTMLSIIDGKKTIKELLEGSSAGSFEALKTLYALWSTGMIAEKEIVKEKLEETVSVEEILKPLPEEEEVFLKKVDEIFSKLNKLSPSELLEVDENSDAAAVKRNYYRLVKEFHPDRHFDSSDSGLKDQLPAIFEAITHAYTLLKDDVARREYFESGGVRKKEVPPHQNAETLFRRGVDDFKSGNFRGAAEAFQWAAKLNENNARYWSYLSLAYIKMEKKLKEAEEAMVQAIRLEPHNPDHYANLGHIYLKGGMKKRAQAAFEKALKIDPENAKAKKGLQQTAT